MVQKRKSIDSKRVESMSSDLDSMIPIGNINNVKNNKKNEEPRLKNKEKIRDYYRRTKRRKQVSVYMPGEIQQKLKAKASEDNKSISDVVKELILDNYFTSEDIKSAYDKGYNSRHSNDS